WREAMTVQVLVPALGESVVGATVGKWLKQEGDPVRAGEALVSLETDKVDLEVTATQSGVLGKIERQAGEDVQAGDVLAIIGDAGNGAAPAPQPAAQPAAPETPAPAPEQAAPAEAAPAAEPERGERVTPV